MNVIDVDNDSFINIVERFRAGSINGKDVIYICDLRAFIDSLDSIIIRNKDYETRQVAFNVPEIAKSKTDWKEV